MVECVTCHDIVFWKQADAGHWIPGHRESVYFDERHIHVQCRKCNRYSHRNPWAVSTKVADVTRAYDAYMLETRGRKVCDELKRLNKTSKTFTVDELMAMRQGYQARLKAAEGKVIA